MSFVIRKSKAWRGGYLGFYNGKQVCFASSREAIIRHFAIFEPWRQFQ